MKHVDVNLWSQKENDAIQVGLVSWQVDIPENMAHILSKIPI